MKQSHFVSRRKMYVMDKQLEFVHEVVKSGNASFESLALPYVLHDDISLSRTVLRILCKGFPVVEHALWEGLAGG